MKKHVLPPGARPHSPWRGSGLTRKHERAFFWISRILILAVLTGWSISIIELRSSGPSTPSAGPAEGRVSSPIARSIIDGSKRATPFINEAALEFFDPLRGESGELEAAFRLPGRDVARTSDPQMKLRFGEKVAGNFAAPSDPGVYKLAVQIDRITREISDLRVITLVPFEQKERGRIGTYTVGTWPFENGGKPKSERYANPSGFIEVTLQNRDTKVSQHFKLRDFLTKDQPTVWPKYLLLDPLLLDKLELTIQELKKQGYKVEHVTVMSGFRTPRYNHSGGNVAGRANLSRHMYGDAADVFVDNDRNGSTDDVNRDGRVDLGDTEVVSRAAERVEREHPSLVGGIGTYAACCGHGPFTHVDVRGYRARWRGSGNG